MSDICGSRALHILQLHEAPVVDGVYNRFNCQWVLQSTELAPIDAPPNVTVKEGDMIFFPDLGGTGGLEDVRIVGMKDVNGTMPLLSAGITSPIFPTAIATNTSPGELRARYEQPLKQVLQQQGLTMEGLFGEPNLVEEFWQNPASERGRRLTEVKDKWVIPLPSCRWLGPKE